MEKLIIDVELFGQLEPRLPRRQSINIDAPCTVEEMASILNLDLEKVGLITINGIQGEYQDMVLSNSRLCFFTHMSGG
jgi:hypothetical protein